MKIQKNGKVVLDAKEAQDIRFHLLMSACQLWSSFGIATDSFLEDEAMKLVRALRGEED